MAQTLDCTQLKCAPSHFARHRFKVDTKEGKKSQRISRMFFKIEKKGKAKVMKEEKKKE